MPVVPLGLKAFKRSDAFTPEVVLENLYLEKDESGISPDGWLRIQRPGITTIATLGGAIRGMIPHAPLGQRLVVAGSSLYANEVSAGAIAGSGIVPMVSTAFFAAILGGSTLYLWNGALVTVAVPDILGVAQTPVDIDQINGYILILCASGSFFWLAPGESTIDPANFATAESSPDGGVAIRRLQDEFAIFGRASTEFWQPTGDADLPFLRVSGRTYERGCASRDTVARFDNALIFHAEDGNIYRGGGAVPQVVSNPGIVERLRIRSADTSAWTFGITGHKWYLLRIPGQGTYALDAATSEWAKWTSGGYDTWIPHVGYEGFQQAFCGSPDDGRLFEILATLDSDAGTYFPRTVSGSVPIGGKPPRNDSITIGIGASADISINFRWKDGQDDYPAFAEELEVRAPYDLATMWRLGSADAPFRTFEASYEGAGFVQFSGMVANQAWQ